MYQNTQERSSFELLVESTTVVPEMNVVLCNWQNPIQNAMFVLAQAGQDEQVKVMQVALAKVIKVVKANSDAILSEDDLNVLFAVAMRS